MSKQILSYNDHTDLNVAISDFLESHGLEVTNDIYRTIEDSTIFLLDSIEEQINE